MSLLDVLGCYYDSAVSTFTEVPEEVNFRLKYQYTSFTNYASYSSTIENLTNNNNPKTTPHCFLQIANNIVPHFMISNNIEKFEYKLKFDKKQTLATCISDRDVAINKSVEVFLANIDNIPKNFYIDVNIKRLNTNIEARIANSKETTNGKDPKDYFREKCSNDFDVSKRGQRGWYSGFRQNSIRYKIQDLRKTPCVFLIEYLFGVKISKSANFNAIIDKLAVIGYSDFGIKDVRILFRLEDIIRRNRKITDYYGELKSLGIEPKTDLKRWQKQLGITLAI